MKALILSAYLLCMFACNSTDSAKVEYGEANPVDHQAWTSLLQKHVSQNGQVNYAGFVLEKAQLEKYLNQLTENKPNNTWSEKAQIAYWINVYNAFTVKLVTDNYPVASIKDIKKGIPFISSVWDIKFIEFKDETMDLNKVEHGILRKQFNEPRIHFAVNCASFSCPRLLNEAYTAEKLEAQLTQMTKDFLSDTQKNQLSEKEVKLSKIFKWFKGDFTKQGTLIDFLNQYAPIKIEDEANISHLEYSWELNE